MCVYTYIYIYIYIFIYIYIHVCVDLLKSRRYIFRKIYKNLFNILQIRDRFGLNQVRSRFGMDCLRKPILIYLFVKIVRSSHQRCSFLQNSQEGICDRVSF